MNDNNEGSRALWFIVAFLLALTVFSNISSIFLLVMLAMAGMWLARNVNLNDVRQNFDVFTNGGTFRNEAVYEDDFYDEDDEEERQVQREPVYRHALAAVESAGLNPDTVKVLAVDLGVVAFRQDGSATVYRTWTVPEDATSIQPFVTLRLPMVAKGRIRFEILDASGRSVFVTENDHKLEPGRNFINPPARLTFKDNMDLDGRWQMRITADDVLLAVHRFEFAEPTTARIRQHLGEDGEIRTDSRLILDEAGATKMSLDDLLSYQDEEEQARRS